MKSIRVLQPGVQSTVQDLGRPHLRQCGLPPGGAVDPISLRTANLLVGNPDDAAALECALVGPVLELLRDSVVAVAGAIVAGMPYCERFRVRQGTRLDLRAISTGAYTYLAIAGGIDVPEVLGSPSTDVKLRFGGVEGRAIVAGDVLSTGESSFEASVALRVAPLTDPRLDVPIRVVDGKDAGKVNADWLARPYTVSSRSDRMGVRLEGHLVAADADPSGTSSVVLPGTIQLPPDGTPIALLADAQTLGGYPQIAHVITADLPRLAQIRPGRAVRFERVTLAAAHQLLRDQARQFGLLRQGIRFKLGTA